MKYWISRIALKTGEVVTERELREDENRFDGPAPATGDVIEVECRGRKFMAKVVGGIPPGRVYSEDTVVRFRVFEVGLDPETSLRFPKPGSIPSRDWPPPPPRGVPDDPSGPESTIVLRVLGRSSKT